MIEKIGNSGIQSLRQWAEELKEKKLKNTKANIEEQNPKGALESSQMNIEQHTENTKEKFKHKSIEQVKTNTAEDLKIASEIRRLKAWEDHVVAHERMHQLAGGEFAGAPSYTYTTGPDGKRYIQGGEVTMYVPSGISLEDSEAVLEKVKRAASAPSDPSPQDMKTAAMASAKQASVKTKLAKVKAKEAYEKSHEQELQLREAKGEDVGSLKKMKFSEVKAFELFV